MRKIRKFAVALLLSFIAVFVITQAFGAAALADSADCPADTAWSRVRLVSDKLSEPDRGAAKDPIDSEPAPGPITQPELELPDLLAKSSSHVVDSAPAPEIKTIIQKAASQQTEVARPPQSNRQSVARPLRRLPGSALCTVMDQTLRVELDTGISGGRNPSAASGAMGNLRNRESAAYQTSMRRTAGIRSVSLSISSFLPRVLHVNSVIVANETAGRIGVVSMKLQRYQNGRWSDVNGWGSDYATDSDKYYFAGKVLNLTSDSLYRLSATFIIRIGSSNIVFTRITQPVLCR